LLLGERVVGRGLRPLHSIAAEIAAIKVYNLTTQIGAEGVPAEVLPIRDRLNELLSRLQESFQRERQFNADVAHELRTPLAGIRSTIEVTLARHREATEYRAALGDCLEITQGMQSLVNCLLTLARLEARQIRFQTESVRLAELVDSCWRPFANRAQERAILFENRIPVETTCPSDPEHLSMVFSNLLDNAVEYADNGGRIWITAGRTKDAVQIAVSNTGCRLSPEQVSRVFDFFWRGDASRPETGAHCGLGLTLVQRIVTALGGNVAAERQDGGIFTLQLTLPSREGILSTQS
jgi:signal transduction histidine kinase